MISQFRMRLHIFDRGEILPWYFTRVSNCLFILFIFKASIVNSQIKANRGQNNLHIPLGTIDHSKKYSLTNGATVINGQTVRANDKLVQRITSSGSSYYLLENSNGRPLYRRKELDMNKQVVVFPDPTYPPGDGHYVVLKKLITKTPPNSLREPVYQGFFLILGDSLHGYLSVWKQPPQLLPKKPKPRNSTVGSKLSNLKRKQQLMARQRTYDVEFSEVDISDMVKRLKRRIPNEGTQTQHRQFQSSHNPKNATCEEKL